MKIKNNQPFLMRLWQYQKERFPFAANGPLIFVFTFSAIAYSRISRGEESFISWKSMFVGFCTTFLLFFLLRVLDEFKDRETDGKYRPELPLSRGLISYRELRYVGLAILVVQVVLVLWIHTEMWVFYLCILLYLALMTVEFFAHDWLTNHLWAYTASHMIIIPLVDLYASGLDWHLYEAGPHVGLIYFLSVSYFNGIVLEVGRKLKAPQSEREGVPTYSSLLGYERATIVWILFLTVTCILALAACHYAGLGNVSYFLILGMYLASLGISFRYMKKPTDQSSKLIETTSGIWTIVMYSTLGGVPGLLKYVLS